MPTFRLQQLASLMRGHERRRLTFTRRVGGGTVTCHRSFPEVYDDVCATIAHLRRHGLTLAPGGRAVVAGPGGYDWLLAALACLVSGVEVVALPETLSDAEATESLAGLSLDGAVVDERIAAFSALQSLPRCPLAGLDALPRASPLPVLGEAPFGLIAFTSGSTARAKLKSFRIAADSTAAFTDAFVATFGLEHDDLWLVCHPFSHIVHFEYVLGGLGWGYDVALADPLRAVMSGAELRPSVLVAVPGVYEQMAALIRRRGSNGAPSAHPQPAAGPRRPTAAAQSVVGDRMKAMIIGAAPSSLDLKRYLLSEGLPLFEGYGMSETNMITCNTPARASFGTVGPAWPGVDVNLDEDGVVVARPHVERTSRYLNGDAGDKETFLPGGWVHTGDLGRMDDGLLTIVGRQKELIVTKGGKKINVASIEARLREIPGVGHALVYGEGQSFLVAVLAPGPDAPLGDRREVFERVQAINATLSSHERVVDFIATDDPLSVESGLLTRSGKPRRAVVADRFAGAIAALYR
jgi:long-subunit acyl-CoA synthetase (AMP-forming)